MSDGGNKNDRFQPAIVPDSKNLRKVDKVIERGKFNSKFRDFGAMITKGVRNERNNLAGFCNPGYLNHHRRCAWADDCGDYEG